MSFVISRTMTGAALVLATFATQPAQAVLSQNWKLEAPQILRSASLVQMQLTGNTVTATTAAPHNFKIGEQVYISTGGSPVWDSIAPKYAPFPIVSVPSATSFTYARTAGNVPATAVTGTASLAWLGTHSDNRGTAYNAATGHLLVARALNTQGSSGIHILNHDGTELGEMKMGADITGKALSSNVATITTAQNHGLAVGQQVMVMNSPPDPVFDGLQTVTAVGSPVSFSFAKTSANVASVASAGTTNIVVGGTVSLDKIRVVDGAIYSCNLSINSLSATDVFAVYYWASESAVPVVIQRNVSSDITAPLTPLSVSNRVLASNVVTLTVSSSTAGYKPGMAVTVALSPPNAVFDGVFTLTGVTANSVTYAKTNANVATAATAGSVTRNAGPAFTVGAALPSVGTLTGNVTIRLGDTFDVVGDGGSNVEIYAQRGTQSGAGPMSSVYKLAYSPGAAAVSSASEISLTGGSTANTTNTNGGLWVDGFGGNIYVSTNVETGIWNSTGETRTPALAAVNSGDNNCAVLTSGSNGRGITIGPKKYFAYVERAASGHPDVHVGLGRAALADITGGFPTAAYIDNTGARNDWVRSNGNGTGDIAWDDQTVRSGRFFAMVTNQYLGSFSIPSVVALSTKTWDGGAGTNKWTDAANWNPDGVPTTDHDVVLDHSSVAGAYTVQIAGAHTVLCRTLNIDGANAGAIRLRVSSEGLPCGTPHQINGNGKSDLSVSGTFQLPQTSKDENTAPRFRVEVSKGLTYVTTKALASNVATLTTLASNGTDSGLAVGDTITVALNPPDAVFDGTYTVKAKTATTITYDRINANVGSSPTAGTVQPQTETIRWTNVGGATSAAADFAAVTATNFGRATASDVAIAAGTPITLSNGFSMQFASASGHVTGDAWVFNPLATGNGLVIKGDGTAVYDLIVQNGGSLEHYANARANIIPGGINVYGGGNKVFFGPNGSYIHGSPTISVLSQWPSDWTAAPVSYPVFDGATTWDPASSYVMDLYPTNAATVPANYPAFQRGFQYGNVSVRNSYAALGMPGHYVYSASNTFHVRIKGSLTVGPDASLTAQIANDVLIEGNVTNNGNATGLVFQTGSQPPVQFGGSTTISGNPITLATGFMVTTGSSVTLSGVDLTVPGGKTATLYGVVNTGGNKVVAGTAAGAMGSVVASGPDGRINGTLKQWVGTTAASYSLPVGSASAAQGATVAYTSPPSTGGSLTASFIASAPGKGGLPLVDADSLTLGKMQDVGYWSIAAGDGLAGGTYDLSLTANGWVSPGDPATLRVVKRADSAAAWTLNGAAWANSFPVVRRTSLSGFSEFGIGQSDNSGIEDAFLY